MEITLSKRSLSNILGIFMFVVVLLGGYYAWSQGLFQGWLPATETVQAAPADEPAMTSLELMYSPTGERSSWDEDVCAGMTEKGCGMFHAMFAEPIWKSYVEEKTVTSVFIETVDTLEDGSQVWKTEVSDGEASAPIYIHVTQNEAGQWLLNRVLFTQETNKYQDQ